MEFFASIADETIGGSYMTLLNTVANMGNTWPKSLSLYAVGRLTLKSDDGTTTSDGFFTLNIACCVAGLVWLLVMWRPVMWLRDLPLSAWRLSTVRPCLYSGRGCRGPLRHNIMLFSPPLACRGRKPTSKCSPRPILLSIGL